MKFARCSVSFTIAILMPILPLFAQTGTSLKDTFLAGGLSS